MTAFYTLRDTIRPRLRLFAVLWLATGSCGFLASYWVSRQPPIVVTSFREMDGLAERGGNIELLVTVTRSRWCTVKVDRWLWQDTGNYDARGNAIRKYVTLPPAVAPPTEIGVPTTFILSIPLPASVTAGQWYFWGRGVDECGWLPFLDRPQRESPVTPVLVSDRAVAAASASHPDPEFPE